MRRGEVRAGDVVVVIGGGPIGLLIGLVARAAGARVILSEPNPYRLELAARFGFDVVDPTAVDLGERVLGATEGAGADVVFEVSGSAAGASVMTELARLRGRLVVVAIFPDAQPVTLFDFFWKELSLVGARVYEPADFEQAIGLLAAGELPLDELITVRRAARPATADVFATLSDNPAAIKILIDCQA